MATLNKKALLASQIAYVKKAQGEGKNHQQMADTLGMSKGGFSIWFRINILGQTREEARKPKPLSTTPRAVAERKRRQSTRPLPEGPHPHG